jgi:hypothetical protein
MGILSSKAKFINKLVWRSLFIVGMVLVGIAFGGIVANYIAWIAIEWLSVSDVGMLVIGLWVMLSTGVGEFLTGRLFEDVPKE